MKKRHIKKNHILIVDDSPKNIQVVAGILQQEGVEMSFALNGKIALSLVESESFDLILLDIIMPEINGYEVCEILKKRPATRDIPIIFLTAKTDTDSIVKGFESGGVDYITKPFNQTELLARVKTHLALKETRASLEEANRQLKEANATKDKFFSIIAHDLKNPFTGLIMGTEVMINHFDTLEKDKLIKILKGLNTSSRMVFNLLENLLNWSRTQIGTIKWEPAKFNMNAIISTNIKLVDENAQLKGIRIQNTINTDLFAYADEGMINTVFRNLLANAVKFTNTGGEIQISSNEYDDIIEISIADTGIGISKEDMKKLFQIDVRHTTLGTANEQGTGLGLNLSKEFIEKNSGRIWVESELGKGSIFYFTLPKANVSYTHKGHNL